MKFVRAIFQKLWPSSNCCFHHTQATSLPLCKSEKDVNKRRWENSNTGANSANLGIRQLLDNDEFKYIWMKFIGEIFHTLWANLSCFFGLDSDFLWMLKLLQQAPPKTIENWTKRYQLYIFVTDRQRRV